MSEVGRGRVRGVAEKGDTIQAGTVQPSTNEPVQPNTEYTNFRADVTYQLGTRNDADLALRLFDEDGNLQASSDFIRVTRAEGRTTSRRITIPKFKITPDAAGNVPAKLFLRAVLIDRSLLTPILKTPEPDYVYDVVSIELVALEVTQVVQDWNHSVPLFDNKPTIVRAHLLTRSAKSLVLKLDKIGLYGTRNGTPLRDLPLSPRNTSYPSVTVLPAAQFGRDDIEAGAYFGLPDDWVSGEVELRFEAPGVTCRELAGIPNDCKVKVKFLPAPNLELKFINISWRNEHNGTYEPNPGETATERQSILSLFPVRRNPRYYGETVLPYLDKGEPELSSVVSLVAEQRFRDGCGEGCNTIYFGLVEGLSPGEFLSNDNAYVPFVTAGGIPQGNPLSFQRHLFSHRLAHVLGLADAVHSSLGLDEHGRKRGWCEERAPASAPNFPEFAEINGHTYPTLGPMDSGADQLVFGVDVNTPANVINPTNTFELMSYCGQSSTGPGRFGWPSKYTYEALAEKLRALSGPVLLAAGAPRNYLLVSGVINWKQQTAMLNPIGAVITASPPVPPPVGDYALELRNAAGQALLTVPFQPLGLAAAATTGTPDTVPFFVPLPADPAVRQVALLHAIATLATRSASPNAPTVDIQFPKGGETVSADPVTLRWQGHDADGDPLVYDGQFSPDGGATWQTLALRWPSETYDVSQRYFSATANGLIRVTASDGFNTATDTSAAAFTVPNHKPVVTLLSPTPNSLNYGAQPIFFQAGVLDPDGPEIDEAKIEWRSSLDGLLGTGSSIQRVATTLSEGTHTISVTATDSGGVAATSTINIVVTGVAPAELAELGLSSANGPVNALLGDDLSFSFTVANHGPNSATGVKVTNTLPAGVSFVGANLSQGSFTQTGQSVVCVLGDLAAGAQATATLSAKAAAQATGSFVATVTGNGVDPNPANNRLEIATTITRPDGPLVADYQFQNVLTSSVAGASPLTHVGVGNAFASETVDGLDRPVLRFPQGNGLTLSSFTNLVADQAYSLVVLFRFEAVSGYRRLLDFKNGVGEAGCYIADHQLFFYLFNSVGSEKTIEPNTWAQVVVTHAADGTVTGYHNGGQRLTFKDDAKVMLPDVTDTLRFFKDNGAEESAGAVARIRLYDSVLTAAEVAGLDRLPPPTGPFAITALRSGDKIILSWPAKAAGFVLQSTADLGAPAGWGVVGTAPTTSGDAKSITVDAAGAPRFFRLIRSP